MRYVISKNNIVISRNIQTDAKTVHKVCSQLLFDTIFCNISVCFLCFVVMVSPQIFLQMYAILYLHLQKKEGMIDFIYGNVYIKKSPVPALVYNRDTVFFMPYLWKRKAVITFT